MIFFFLWQNTLLKWYKKRRTTIPKDKSEKSVSVNYIVDEQKPRHFSGLSKVRK